jgi:hypothetical protein
MRRSALLLAVLVVAACSSSSDEAAKTQARTTTQKKTTLPSKVVEIPVKAEARRGSGKYASQRELEWAASWLHWQENIATELEFVNELFADPERQQRARPGTKSGKRLASALRFLRACADAAIERGAPPTNRLEPVATETADVCVRIERAVAAAEAANLESWGSADGAFASDHLEAATREARSFVPGLDAEIDDLPLRDGPGQKSRIQIRYTYAASRLVEEQATISCFSPVDWRRKVPAGKKPGSIGGFVEVHGAVGNLAPPVCRWLDRLVYREERPQALPDLGYTAQAVLVLAHEAQHAAGVRSEAKAECYALQRVEPLARSLGVEAAYASVLADFVWTSIYPLEPAGYSSDECRPGGELDLRPRVAAWPS